MEINDEYLMIFWDVLDSKYRPKKIDVNFTNCYINEVFDGDIGYTPLRKDRYNLRYIFKR